LLFLQAKNDKNWNTYMSMREVKVKLEGVKGMIVTNGNGMGAFRPLTKDCQ